MKYITYISLQLKHIYVISEIHQTLLLEISDSLLDNTTKHSILKITCMRAAMSAGYHSGPEDKIIMFVRIIY